MLMTTPMITNIVMNGIVCSRFLNKNSTIIDTMVSPNVITLKLRKVCFIMSNGFVNALELAATKNAWTFYILNGKNYIKI